MNTFNRALRRMALPVLSALIITAALAATAAATTVDLRIESPNETIFNGTVNTAARSMPELAGNCDGTAGTASASNATVATAVADAIDTLGPAAPAFFAGYGGTYICRIGAYSEAYPNGSWFLKINNLDSPPPLGYVTAGDAVKDGDDVLVYYSGGNPTSSLDLRLPAAAKPGVAVNGTVDSWSIFSGDVKSAASGATVTGGGASGTAGADGSFSLTFPQSGRFLVTATKAGSVRSSAWITIDAAAPLVRVNRFVKCNRTYRKRSKKHRRCVRIVRAKQAAAAAKS